MRLALAALVVLSVPASVQSAAALQQFVDVREIPADTLHDVAMTLIGPGRPVIYYNPRLLQQVGPTLAAFVMTHEYGHVRYGHTGGLLHPNKVAKRPHASSVDATQRVRQELEADCYAARILDETNPAALRAALQFFTAMGPFRFDSLHPAGAQRAAMLTSCRSEGQADRPAKPVAGSP